MRIPMLPNRTVFEVFRIRMFHNAVKIWILISIPTSRSCIPSGIFVPPVQRISCTLQLKRLIRLHSAQEKVFIRLDHQVLCNTKLPKASACLPQKHQHYDGRRKRKRSAGCVRTDQVFVSPCSCHLQPGIEVGGA